MQISPFITLIFAFTSIMAHGQKAVEATLQNIIESETQAFTKMSFADVVKTFWLLDDKTLALVTIADGTQITANKDDILSNTSVPPPGHATFVKTNYRFIINGSMASATYDQVVTIAETGDKIYSHEMHIFQKVGETWKIHLSSVHQYTP